MSPPSARPLILAVDDDPGIHEAFRLIFEDEYEVLDALDGPQAVEALAARPIDVMLLDIRMPGIGGLAVLAQARRLRPQAQVIVVSCVDEAGTALEAIRLGAVDYVTKPFEADDLALIVRKALELPTAAGAASPRASIARVLIISGDLGSAIALVDPSGQVVTEYTYEPFGATTVTGASSENHAQYTGRENDGTGLYYYRARYYSPTLHRFLSEDPRRAKSVTNRFAYVGNNPANFIDPSGTVDFNIGGHHIDAQVSVTLAVVNVQYDLESTVSFNRVLPFSFGAGVDIAIDAPDNVAGTVTVGAGRNLGIGTNFEQGSLWPQGVNVSIGRSIGSPVVFGGPLGRIEVDPHQKIRRLDEKARRLVQKEEPPPGHAGDFEKLSVSAEPPDILEISNRNVLGKRK